MEASPKPVNYWLKINANPNERDIPINSGGRFLVNDFEENGYTTRMQLKITDVRPSDFGTFACVSRNSLGEVQTNVQLQGQNSS